MDAHHIIPISLYGEDIGINTIKIEKSIHRELHDMQNIPYSLLRKYRNKVNGILVPNESTLSLKGDLLKEYFSMARILIEEQKDSIRKQTDRYGYMNGYHIKEEDETFNTLIDNYISQQIIRVERIINGKGTSYFKDYLVTD